MSTYSSDPIDILAKSASDTHVFIQLFL